MRKLILEYLFSGLIVAVALVVVIAFYTNYQDTRHKTITVTQEEFSPVTSSGIEFITPGPYHRGQMLTVLDGLCNTSDVSLQVISIVGFQEVEVSQLIARTIILNPTVTPPLPHPLDPGCIATQPISGPLPQNIPNGKWKLYLTLTVNGTKAGQVQYLNVLSNTIEVVD